MVYEIRADNFQANAADSVVMVHAFDRQSADRAFDALTRAYLNAIMLDGETGELIRVYDNR